MEMSLALPFFHALTGCDTVSAFFGIGKAQAFKVWMAMGELLTKAFMEISSEEPENVIKCDNYKTIEKFIGMCYDCKYAQEAQHTVQF